MYQNHRSEEGDSGGYRAPRHGQEPDSSNLSTNARDTKEGQTEEQKDPNLQAQDDIGFGGSQDKQNMQPVTMCQTDRSYVQEPNLTTNQEDGARGSSSTLWEQSCVTVKSWYKTLRFYMGKKNKAFPQEEDGMSNPVSQPPSSGNPAPPGVAPPQEAQKPKHLKGIFYDMDGDASWLIDRLKDESIPGYDFITCQTPEELKAAEFSLVILCLSYESRCEGNVTKYLESCREPVIGVITGLENISSEKDKREYWENVSEDFISKFDIITLTKQDEEIIRTTNSETRVRLDRKLRDMKDILQNSAAKNPLLQFLQKTKVDIGIFSRSDESDYSWLVELLRSADFSDRVRSVTPCYISNSGRQKFREDVSKCNVGILYHTKNRGRINVTDLAGALYDEELGYLSGKLGKDNVIVVIDDLEDSSDIEKKRILQSQRSIKNLARGLFLFSHDEKLLASAERKITQLRAMITDSKALNPESSEDPPSPGTPWSSSF